MEAQSGTKHLRENGINSPADLIHFPWDKEPAPSLTNEEYNDMQEEMKAINAAAKQKDESE